MSFILRNSTHSANNALHLCFATVEHMSNQVGMMENTTRTCAGITKQRNAELGFHNISSHHHASSLHARCCSMVSFGLFRAFKRSLPCMNCKRTYLHATLIDRLA